MTKAAHNEFPALADLAAHDDGQWAEPGMDAPSGDWWPRATTAPTPGAETWVRVDARTKSTAVGDELWMLFRPELSALNGWDEHPADIAASAFVRCRVRAAKFDEPSRRHWRRVEVIEALGFRELETRFVARQRPELATWRLSTGSLTRYRDWELWFAPHDDAGYWLLARLDQEAAHVVAAGEWLHGANTDYDDAWAGHVVLPIPAWREICRPR